MLGAENDCANIQLHRSMMLQEIYTGQVGPLKLAIPEILLVRQWFLPVPDRRTGASVEPCNMAWFKDSFQDLQVHHFTSLLVPNGS